MFDKNRRLVVCHLFPLHEVAGRGADAINVGRQLLIWFVECSARAALASAADRKRSKGSG